MISLTLGRARSQTTTRLKPAVIVHQASHYCHLEILLSIIIADGI